MTPYQVSSEIRYDGFFYSGITLITYMITDRIRLHSVLLPLLIKISSTLVNYTEII